MTIELKMLAWSIVLGIAYVMIAGALVTRQRGLKWNAGNRDGTVPATSGAAGRAERASRNFLETFGFFAAAVLAVSIANRQSSHTGIGAQLYLWARVVYLPVYIVGIPYLRTAVWTVSLIGIFEVLSGLLGF